MAEAIEIGDLLNRFTESWLSHGVPVKGEAHLFFGRFVVLIADETATGVSGCSTDSSVQLIREIEKQFHTSMFERTNLAFVLPDADGGHRIEILPLTQVQYAIDNGFLSADTPYFNNLVQTRKDLEENWIIPMNKSWLAKKVVLKMA